VRAAALLMRTGATPPNLEDSTSKTALNESGCG
jgi:hypothetical protein